MKCLSVPLAYFFNPWFKRQAWNWSSFQSKIHPLIFNSLNSLSDKAPVVCCSSQEEQQSWWEACHLPQAHLGEFPSQSRFPVVTPLHNHSQAVPGSSFDARTAANSACSPHSAWGPEWLCAEETQGKVNHDCSDRGWFSSSTERVHNFRYTEYFARNVEWLGNHLSSVLSGYSEHELNITNALNSGR